MRLLSWFVVLFGVLSVIGVQPAVAAEDEPAGARDEASATPVFVAGLASGGAGSSTLKGGVPLQGELQDYVCKEDGMGASCQASPGDTCRSKTCRQIDPYG